MKKISYLKYSDLRQLEQFLDKVTEVGDFILNLNIDEVADILSNPNQDYVIGCFVGDTMVGFETLVGADIIDKTDYLLSNVYILKEFRGSAVLQD